MNNRTVICWREDSCQQLLTVWRKNGLSAVKLCAQTKNGDEMSGYHRFCFSPRLALRLAGLQVHQRQRTGSPGKAFTPRPGKKGRLLP